MKRKTQSEKKIKDIGNKSDRSENRINIKQEYGKKGIQWKNIGQQSNKYINSFSFNIPRTSFNPKVFNFHPT